MTDQQLHIDLSHRVSDGLITYPGLPGPVIGTHVSRDAAEQIYGPGVTFHIGMLTICTNTGTYLDVPFHRFADGHDLADLDLARVAAVPAVCFDVRGQRAIELNAEDLVECADMAVLLRTDHSQHFGTPDYGVASPYISESTSAALVAADVACVGIDALNVDNTDSMARPVHTALLGAGIPIIEHLRDLDALPPEGFAFSAVPPKFEGAGTFTVRAFATLPR